MIGNATLIIPAPVFVVACAAGMVYGPLQVGVIAAAGAAIGELTGYIAGYGGEAIIPEGKLYHRLQAFMQRRGMLAIFLLGAIPNPIFDVGGLIAGAMKMPVWKFLLAAWLGKTIRLGFTAWACLAGIPWLQQIFRG
jgi:membrane protein YqaA with SNARE-associated domain